MRIFHTADWHLGQNFYGKDRREEHGHFLAWLIDQMKNEKIDTLIVAGDIFDTGTPPNYALEMYYNFLRQIPDTSCQQVILVGGNHDSPAMLQAPKELLKHFRIHVGGCAGDDIEDEVIVCRDDKNNEIGIVCAVPFLRDRDLRKSIPGESYEDKQVALVAGLRQHYQSVYQKAKELQNKCGSIMPIIATGHLAVKGGQLSESVRDIYIGNAQSVSSTIFPPEFDYIALGHLHIAQKVADNNCIQYAGSPIALSFSELSTYKQVLCIELVQDNKSVQESASAQLSLLDDTEINKKARTCIVKKITIPQWQDLRQIRGGLDEILQNLEELKNSEFSASVWLDIIIDSTKPIPNIQQTISETVAGTSIEILTIRYSKNLVVSKLTSKPDMSQLIELRPNNVFDQLLAVNQINDPQKSELISTFQEAYSKTIQS